MSSKREKNHRAKIYENIDTIAIYNIGQIGFDGMPTVFGGVTEGDAYDIHAPIGKMKSKILWCLRDIQRVAAWQVRRHKKWIALAKRMANKIRPKKIEDIISF